MNAMPFVIGTIAVFVIAYRFYFSFVAAKVAVRNDLIKTPAHRLYDGQNYYPMNKWVLFGHHFAAIAGAGPLVGPVLAAQFGFMPGFLWMLIGAVMAGSVHDFIILTASVQNDGKSLAAIAKAEINKVSGITTTFAIILIIVVALAGLGLVVIAGRYIPDSQFAGWFTFDHRTLTILIAVYGFLASVLPVWLLLSPRDYLSSIMKISVIGLLAIGLIIVAPEIKCLHSLSLEKEADL